MNVSKGLKWLEEESDRLAEECHSNADPHKTVNNSFLEGFNYALANVQGLEQPQLNDNQQIVLEKLKIILADYDVYNKNPFETIYCFVDDYGTEKYYENLTAKQEVQVLQVFIQWALEQEE